MRLSGKVAVVTGGGTGIGRATALVFAREGARVAVADRNEATGAATADDIRRAGGEGAFVSCDVAREEDVARLYAAAERLFGGVDVSFANAGIGEVGAADSLPLEGWRRVIDINLTGVFLCAKYAIGAMRRRGGGSIINNASILGHVGSPGATAYAAAKGGVVLLTKTLALDYAREGIRVNAVCPGYIKTPMLLAGPVKDQLETLAALHPLRRLGEPEEVANCVLFLASDESSFVTGASLLVDGGYTAQ
jgi:NAD(P)-dependent dehydrogenase (short-subunit alcohol dehydrogenase family)